MITRSSGFPLAVALIGLLSAAPAFAQDKQKDLDLDKIPKKVMDALNAKFPTAKIHKWAKEKEGGAVVYDIEFKLSEKKHEADIREDGVILEYEVEVAAKDLPAAVTKAIEMKYPKSKLKDLMKIMKVDGAKEMLHGYEIIVTTADNRSFEVTVAPDGKFLEDGGAKKEQKK